MKTRPSAVVPYAALLLTALVAAAAHAAPIPAGPDAKTQRDADAQIMPHRLEQIDAYRRATKDPEPLRDRAAAFIEEVQRKLHSDTPGRPWPDIVATGETLIADGAADSLVQTTKGS